MRTRRRITGPLKVMASADAAAERRWWCHRGAVASPPGWTTPVTTARCLTDASAYALSQIEEERWVVRWRRSPAAAEQQGAASKVHAEIGALSALFDSAKSHGGGGGGGAVEGAAGSHGPSNGELTSLTSKVSATEKVLEAHGRTLSEVKALVSEGQGSRDTAVRSIEQLEKTVDTQLDKIGSILNKLKQDVDGVRDVSRATVSELRSESAALKAALEEMHNAASSAHGMTFPLAVCGQTLVVAALLFYAMTGGGGRRRSHLP